MKTRDRYIVRVGGAVDRVQASLRFFGEELDPGEITRALRRFPTVAFRKGDVREGSGVPPSVRSKGGWILEGPPADPPTVENVIRALLALVSADRRVWRGLTRRFDADVFCGVFMEEFNRGFELSPSLSRELAARHLLVGFDIYGPGMPNFDDRSGPPDLGQILARGQLPSKRLLRTMARRELKDGDDVDSDVWIAVAAAILDDAGLFEDAVGRHWRRKRSARRRDPRIADLALRHRQLRSARLLASRARAIVSLAPGSLAEELAGRLKTYEATFR